MKTLDSIILNAEKILLTANDIIRLTDNKVKIVVYSDLVNYKNIDDVFEDKQGIVLLYQNTQNSGHWVLLYKLPKNILYFFDPYGFQLDSELKWSSYLVQQGFLKEPALSYLIKNSQYKLLQNKVKYQQLANGVNTCGRHIICRFNYRNMKDKEYQVFLFNNQHYNPDFWVSILTM